MRTYEQRFPKFALVKRLANKVVCLKTYFKYREIIHLTRGCGYGTCWQYDRLVKDKHKIK